jgi:hypothetical protein
MHSEILFNDGSKLTEYRLIQTYVIGLQRKLSGVAFSSNVTLLDIRLGFRIHLVAITTISQFLENTLWARSIQLLSVSNQFSTFFLSTIAGGETWEEDSATVSSLDLETESTPYLHGSFEWLFSTTTSSITSAKS